MIFDIIIFFLQIQHFDTGDRREEGKGPKNFREIQLTCQNSVFEFAEFIFDIISTQNFNLWQLGEGMGRKNKCSRNTLRILKLLILKLKLWYLREGEGRRNNKFLWDTLCLSNFIISILLNSFLIYFTIYVKNCGICERRRRGTNISFNTRA